MKYLSLFSGIGGFEIGISNAFRGLNVQKVGGRAEVEGRVDEAWKRLHPFSDERTILTYDSSDEHINRGINEGQPTCIGYSEIDPYADAIYKYNFGGHNYGDCTKIDPTTIPDFDLLVGGFPCQAFSIAGKRRGFDDTRGTLIYDVMRILKEKQPRHFILENVKGLLSHDSGNTFRTIITSLAELGYAVEWQVLNAKNFGVPQNRERVFIVGHLGGFGGRQVFPIRENNPKDIVQLNSPTHSNDRLYGGDGVAPTLNTMQGGNRQPFIDMSTMEAKLTSEARTLQARYNKGYSHRKAEVSGVYDGARIRRLTPKECERLMGYPDDWTKWGLGALQQSGDNSGYEIVPMSDTRRYKACGNGVVSNVVEEVVRRLYA